MNICELLRLWSPSSHKTDRVVLIDHSLTPHCGIGQNKAVILTTHPACITLQADVGDSIAGSCAFEFKELKAAVGVDRVSTGILDKESIITTDSAFVTRLPYVSVSNDFPTDVPGSSLRDLPSQEACNSAVDNIHQLGNFASAGKQWDSVIVTPQNDCIAIHSSNGHVGCYTTVPLSKGTPSYGYALPIPVEVLETVKRSKFPTVRWSLNLNKSTLYGVCTLTRNRGDGILEHIIISWDAGKYQDTFQHYELLHHHANNVVRSVDATGLLDTIKKLKKPKFRPIKLVSDGDDVIITCEEQTARFTPRTKWGEFSCALTYSYIKTILSTFGKYESVTMFIPQTFREPVVFQGSKSVTTFILMGCYND